MKTFKNIACLTLCFLGGAYSLTAQTTATDFTVNDCSGTSHHLFAELDAGKIIVIAWVMPCGSCAAPSKAAYDAVQSFASSHPNKVSFYLVDDYANSSCNTLTSWGNSNFMPNSVKFSNTSISMSDYGTPGMPKIVVLGGASHTVGYNLNSGVTQVGVTAAINQFISLGTEELNQDQVIASKVIPNPVSGNFSIEFDLKSEGEAKIEIINSAGQVVATRVKEVNGSGIQVLHFDSDLNLKKGMYIARISSDYSVMTSNFVVE